MVGLNIKNIRCRKKLTQKYLADKLGISRQAICMWETGKRELKVTMLNKLSKALDVSVNEIVTGKREVGTSNKRKADFSAINCEDPEKLKVN